MKVNGILLSIGGESILVHLEKTRCNNCGYEHNWCAIPEYVLVNKSYRDFVARLDILPCSGCGKPLSYRGVIWKES